MNRVRCLFACLVSVVLIGTAHGQANQDPRLVIDIDRLGVISVVADDTAERLNESASRQHVLSVLDRYPNMPILIRSDVRASFDSVSQVVAWLRESGADSIGILTDRDE